MNEDFGIDFIARCIAGEGLETANKRQWKLQAGPRILLSDNPETQTTTISATGEDITVDDALSTTSENPVQNKVITNELLTKPTCVLPNGTKVNNQNIMQLTRAQYDAIQNKDPNTYYMVTGDSEDAVFYRTAYVPVASADITQRRINDNRIQFSFAVPEDFSLLEVRVSYSINCDCGVWQDATLTFTDTLSIPAGAADTPRAGRKIYSEYGVDGYVGPDQTHVEKSVAFLLGSNFITYENGIATIEIGNLTAFYNNVTDTDPDNTTVTINSVNIFELGYVAYGSDNINITTDSYTAGTGISIDANHAISLAANYAANIEATMDPDTYVITLRLRDQNGVYIGTAQTIDLPLESVVVSGTYDDTTKKIILTLENGQTVEFSVADLVSGLETTAHAASTYLTQNDAANTYATQLAVSGLKTVPAVTSSDDGKILTADYTGGIGSYSWEPAPSGLPASTSSDSGKVLTVDSQGSPNWATASGGLPSYTTPADQNKVLRLTMNGWNLSPTWEAVREVPSYTSNQAGGILRINDTGTGYYWALNVIPTPTSNDDGKVLTTHWNSTYGEWTNSWEAVPGGSGLPASTSADEGKVLTVDSSGDPDWSTLPSVDEVPVVGSSDDGKVLTASYSGGTGSYSWQPASGGGGGLQVETDGTNYWITVNGIRLYFASSAPTGTIPDGSLGIGW